MKMQEKKLNRFNLYSKIANALFILTIIIGILSILTAIGTGIFLKTTNFDYVGFVNEMIAKEATQFELVLPYFTVPTSAIVVATLYIALGFALTAFIMKAVANLFKNIVVDKTPFTQKISKGIKTIGIAMFVYAAVIFVLSGISASITPLTAVNFDIKWATLMYGLLLLSLGEIFEFGMNLQHDSESIV